MVYEQTKRRECDWSKEVPRTPNGECLKRNVITNPSSKLKQKTREIVKMIKY